MTSQMTHFVMQDAMFLCHIWAILKLAPDAIVTIHSIDQKDTVFFPRIYARKVQDLANFCPVCDYAITSVLDKKKAVSFAHVYMCFCTCKRYM